VKAESGQALVEYVAALTVILALCLALATLYLTLAKAGQKSDSGLRTMFTRAPYSLPGSSGGSGQCVEDLLMH
jgi:hypothetical protein